jgi:hypothetical protein
MARQRAANAIDRDSASKRAFINELGKRLAKKGKNRWKAAAELSEFVQSAPSLLWPRVLKYGLSEDDDLRQAVATCIVEHVLEYHFGRYFPRLEHEVLMGNQNLGQTFLLCSKFGQSTEAENSRKWENLASKVRRGGCLKPRFGRSAKSVA